MEGPKTMKRKISQEYSDEKTSNSEKKRKKKESNVAGGTGMRPKNCPLSERQQLALLMQMTAEEKTEQSNTPPPQARKTPGSSGRKDKVHKRNERGETPLHLATIRGDLDSIMDLIKQGADINVQDYAGWTPLHEACNHGYHHIAKFLLESGANVNSKGFENDYPLHDAVSNNHHDLVELLLKHGANPLLPNKHGERPMDLSESDSITKMMQQEVISSDESDSSSKPSFKTNKDSQTWRQRSESESDQSLKSPKQTTSNPASRQLFKSEKKFKKRSIISSSFESDDSDEGPLIHQTTSVKQFGISSSSNYAVTNKKTAFGRVKNRKKTKKRKSLFSTSTSEDDSSDTEKTNKKLHKSTTPSKTSQVESSEEEIPLAQVARSHNIAAQSCLNEPASTVKQINTTDVYDLTDDFSNENDAISLKPETGRFFQNWESPNKSSSLKSPNYFLSRKPKSSNSTINFSTNKSIEKKIRKPSKETEKDLERKTVLIKPASPPVKYKTSEMLFDQLFKSTPTEQPKSLENKIPASSSCVTTATSTLFSSTACILSPSSGFSNTRTMITTTTIPSNFMDPLSANYVSSCIASPTPPTTTQSFNPIKPPSSSPDSLKILTKSSVKLEQKSADENDKLVTKEPVVVLPSVATTSTKEGEKLKAVEDTKKTQTDLKEKVTKTLSEPSKSTQKTMQKVDSSKKSSSKQTMKKEVKQDLKKVSLISNSAFIGDIDSVARKRFQEKQLQRKKQQQKRRESFPNVKVEKKAVKRPEVSLLDSSWLGMTPDKQKIKKTQKIIKKEEVEAIAETQSGSLPVCVNSPIPTAGTEAGHSHRKNATLKPTLMATSGTSTFATTSSTVAMSSSANMTSSSANMMSSSANAMSPSASVISSSANVMSSSENVMERTSDTDLAVEKSVIDVQAPATVKLEQNTTKAEDKPLDGALLQPPYVDEDNEITEVKQEDLIDKSVENGEKIMEQEEMSEGEKLLQEYIQQRLSVATICLESSEPKRLPVYIPLSKLQKAAKNLNNDKLNSYEERAVIQKLTFEKRKRFANIIPQAPQCYWEYMTFTGGYLLNGRKESLLSVPVLAAPPHLNDSMVDLFNGHEEQRVRLRVQHAIEREKLIISCEQEIMREHCRAARTAQNQQVPYSVCSVLMDNEVYNLPRVSNTEVGKPSIRDRFNTRLFISWIQDIGAKYDRMKSELLMRQKHEGETLYAMQKTEWRLKLQDLDHSKKEVTLNEINDLYVPMVNIADDFDLLPA